MRIIHASLLLLSLAAGPVIAGELEDKLKAAGVSDDTIKILVEQGKYTQPGELMLPVERLEKRLDKLNIPGADLDKIVDHFGQSDQDFSKMSLADLLKHVAGSPNDEAGIKALRARPEVMQAEEKTQKWVVTLDNKLEPVKTESYLKYLKKAEPIKEGMFQKQPLKTLDMALGKVDMDLSHPLLGKNDPLDENGVDSHGLDWRKVPEKVRKALMWAQVGAQDYLPAKPRSDLGTYYKQAATPCTDCWVQTIVDLYTVALDNGDISAKDVDALKLP